MKKQFSKSWVGSRQVRKQRKYLANAPQHIRKKLLSAHLSKELREKYNRRAFPLRKGDTIKIMNGENKGKTGKISVVDMMKLRVAIEGIQISKKDGTKVNIFFAPSNLKIIELNLEDKMRIDSIKKSEKSMIKENKKQEQKENKK